MVPQLLVRSNIMLAVVVGAAELAITNMMDRKATSDMNMVTETTRRYLTAQTWRETGMSTHQERTRRAVAIVAGVHTKP